MKTPWVSFRALKCGRLPGNRGKTFHPGEVVDDVDCEDTRALVAAGVLEALKPGNDPRKVEDEVRTRALKEQAEQARKELAIASRDANLCNEMLEEKRRLIAARANGPKPPDPVVARERARLEALAASADREAEVRRQAVADAVRDLWGLSSSDEGG